MTRKLVDVAEQDDGDAEPVRYTVLSRRAIAIWAVLVVAAGVGVAVWLLLAYGAGDDPRVQLDAIRTAGTLVVGAGGAAALLLAARRQRSTEIALKQKERDQADAARAHALQERIADETRAQQERAAAHTEYDAAQRRVTDQYTAAAAQLGSDKNACPPRQPLRTRAARAGQPRAAPDDRQRAVRLHTHAVRAAR